MITALTTIVGPVIIGVGVSVWDGRGDGSIILCVSAVGWLIGIAAFNMGYL